MLLSGGDAMTLCGHVNAGWGHAPLVCNLDVGHDGPHGIRQLPTLPPYVRWWSLVDESGLLSTRLQATEPDSSNQKARN